MAAIIPETLSPQNGNTDEAVPQPAMDRANKKLWAHPKPSVQAEPSLLTAFYIPPLGGCSAFSLSLLRSSELRHKNRAVTRQYSRHSSISCRLCDLGWIYEAPATRTAHNRAGWLVCSFRDRSEKELLSLDVFQRIRVGDQRGSESLENLLSAELAKPQLSTLQEPGLFPCRRSPRNHDFDALHNFSTRWNCPCSNAPWKYLHRKNKKI